jgi:hypothetical protein
MFVRRENENIVLLPWCRHAFSLKKKREKKKSQFKSYKHKSRRGLTMSSDIDSDKQKNMLQDGSVK